VHTHTGTVAPVLAIPSTLVPVSTHRSLIPVIAIPIAAPVSGFHSILDFAAIRMAALPSLIPAIPAAVLLPTGSAFLSVIPVDLPAFVTPALTAAFPHSAVSACVPSHILSTESFIHLVMTTASVFLVAPPIP